MQDFLAMVRDWAVSILSTMFMGLVVFGYTLAGNVHDNARDIVATQRTATQAADVAATADRRLERFEEKIDGALGRLGNLERYNGAIQGDLSKILQEIGRLQGAQDRALAGRTR